MNMVILGVFLVFALVGALVYRFPIELGHWLERFRLRLAGFKRKRMTTPSGDLVYFEGGNGEEILVLIHGFMVHAGNWSRVAPTLKKRYRVVVVDLPGHGESPTPKNFSLKIVMEAIAYFLLQVADNQRITLIGNSMGGGIALRFALDYPEKVHHLIAINTAALNWEIEKELLLPTDRKGALRKMQQIVSADLKLPDFILDGILKENKMEFAQLFNEAVESGNYHLDEELKNLKPKVHLIWGERDGVFPMEYARQLHAQLPDSELVTLANDAHVPQNTNPKVVLEIVKRVVG